MDLSYKQEIKVGLLVLLALGLLVGGLTWLSGRQLAGGGRVTFPVTFRTISGLTEGDPVQISGVTVGRVHDVRLEDVDRVVVQLSVNWQVRPRRDARAEIRPLDFLGAKYVHYDPGRSAELLPEDAAIVGSEETDLAATAGNVVEGLTQFLDRSEVMISQARATMVTAEQALDVMTRLGRGPIVTETEATLASVRSAAARLDSTLSNPAIDKSVSQLDELTASVTEMAQGLAVATTALGQILQRVEAGDGTFSRVMNDTTLYNELHQVLVELKLLLRDIRERPGRYAPGAIKIF